MSGYALMSVLDLRRREEKAAQEQLAHAGRKRAEAESEESRQLAEVSAARQQFEWARLGTGRDQGNAPPTSAGGPIAASTGAAAAAQARFVARRRHEWARAQARLDAFRSGPLQRARAAETTARERHVETRQARDALEKHEARFREGERRFAARREETAMDDLAQATKLPRDGQRQR